ncbi:hypothetical protein GCM10027321_15450 [Massilia terrae]|uniref:TonB C-terminal domain-containing protein n=1 Tax=Massilia terrae TaxID=1811224 RepID=A0ABT2D124_9BURK|nr:hypothetical protein [Massilia terrae]MCS0659926.1 hypothetical protein [Massilia terrae]
MNKANWKLALAIGLCVLGAHDAPAQNRVRSNGYLGEVRDLLEKGDCAGVLKPLNAGLEEKLAPVQLVAGAMFDHGICVKPDWDRAMHFYTLADQGGEHAAAFRLAAGFAAPDRGPDVAAALWWLSRTKPAMQVHGCKTAPDTRDHPDRFVAELKTWPQDKLRACNYAAGLVATVAGEVHYPSRALSYSVGGDYVVRFMPGVGRIEMKAGQTREFELVGIVDGNMLAERKSLSVKNSFAENLSEVAQRALARYPRPQGIDPRWQFDVLFRFEVTRD